MRIIFEETLSLALEDEGQGLLPPPVPPPLPLTPAAEAYARFVKDHDDYMDTYKKVVPRGYDPLSPYPYVSVLGRHATIEEFRKGVGM
jgi:hypothetical protein